MCRFFFFFLFFIVTSSFSLGQYYNYRQYTPQEGLPSSEIYHVYQDSKGYIWFATDNGVSRYNGYEFQNFSSEQGLTDNTVFEIYEDWKGRIWFITFSGKLSYFYNDSIKAYKYNNAIAARLSHYPVTNKKSFYVDKNSTVYFSDRHNGIISVDSMGNSSVLDKRFFMYIFDSIPLINVIVKNEQDSLQYLANNSEYRIKTQLPRSGFPKTVLKVKNFIFFSVHNELFKLEENELKQNLKFENEIIWTSSYNDEIWIGTKDGVFCFENYDLSAPPKYKLLPNNAITSVLIDHEGGIWFSTLENGVFYLPCLNVKSVSSQNRSSANRRITSLYEYENKIWYGTYTGAFGFIENDALKPLCNFPGIKGFITVTDITKNDKNQLIVLTFIGVYPSYLFNKQKGVYLFDPDKPVVNFGGWKIISSKEKNKFWIVARASVSQMEINDQPTIKKIKMPIGITNHAILENDNYLLIGSSNGLWRYEPSTDKLELLNIHPKLNDRITCLIKGNNGAIIVGTKKNGSLVIQNNKVVCEFDHYGITNKYITSLYSHENSVWIGTKGEGVYKVEFLDNNYQNFQIQKWTTDDGILSNEINDIIVNDTATFLGTNEGVNIIEYKNYNSEMFPPPMLVKQVKVQNSDTVLLTKYTLKHNQNTVSILLTGLAYRYSGKLKYKYRLNEASQEGNWTITNNRNIRLAYLSPGKYTFQAKALNGDIESNKTVEIEIEITPPFWERWWFYLSIILIVVVTAYFLYKSRIKEINKRYRLEKEMLISKNKFMREIEKYRQQALTQQMNPHFIFNSLNSIQLFVYQNNKTLSSKYLSKFSKLVRIILENSQNERIPFHKEFDALVLYLELEEMRLQGKMKFEVEIEKSINTNYYMIPPLLIQPFVENAIWHGIIHKETPGMVKISLKDQGSNFLCTVEDDGIGIKKAIEIQEKKKNYHTSLGSEITQKRFELLSSHYGKKMNINYIDLYNDAGPAGTRVEIEIPKVTMENHN